MTPKIVLSLGVAAVVTTVAATALWQSNHASVSTEGRGERQLQNIVTRANDISQVVVREGAETLIVEHKDNKWRLMPSGYPVDSKKLQKTLVGLVQLVKIEPKTDVPSKYSILQVEDAGSEDSKSREVVLKDAKGEKIGAVILGKAAAGRAARGKSAQYVRTPGEKTSWLVLGNVDTGVALKKWIATNALKTNVTKVKQVQIRHSDGHLLEIKKDGKTEAGTDKFVIKDMPDGRKIKSQIGVRYTATDLANIDFDKVRKFKEDATATTSTVLEYDDGMKLGFRLAEEDGQGWLSIKVLEKGKDVKTADQIAKSTAGWEYGLSGYKTQQFKKRLENLLEQPE